MDTKWKVIIVTLVAGFVGFNLQANSPLGPTLWGEGPAGPEPAGSVLGLLIVYGVLEAIAFGLGVAFLAFGWSKVANTRGVSKGLATGAAAAIAWGLLSWVPHSAMHMTNAADDFGRLVLIEYVFHVTLITAASVLALFAYRVSQAGGATPAMTTSDAREPVVAMAR